MSQKSFCAWRPIIRPSVEWCATAFAYRSASASRESAGTREEMTPQSFNSCAETVRPVRMTSYPRFMPSLSMTMGSSVSMPPKPILVWRREKRASCAATTRSHCRTRLNPSPKAAPCTAAMIVLSARSRSAVPRVLEIPRIRRDWGSRSPRFSPKDSTGVRVTSSPEQKSVPAPARIITLISSSSSARRSLRPSSSFISGILIAFLRCGRLSVILAMCRSTVSYRTMSSTGCSSSAWLVWVIGLFPPLPGAPASSRCRRPAGVPERTVLVRPWLLRHPEKPFADHVALDLVRSAADAAGLPDQVIPADALRDIVARAVDDPGCIGDLQADRRDPGRRGRRHQLLQRPGSAGKLAAAHAGRDPLHELATDGGQHVRLTDQLPGDRVGVPARVCRQAEQVGLRAALRRAASPPRSDDPGVGGRAAHHAPLVEKHPGSDRPSVVELPYQRRIGKHHLVEELLAELAGSVGLPDRDDAHAGLAQVDDEDAQAAVLGHVPVGPCQAEPEIAQVRARGPYLGAVQDPALALQGRAGDRAGQIQPTGRLGQQLRPELIAAQDRGDVSQPLLLGPELEQGRRDDGQRGGVEPERHLVTGGFLGEHLLVFGRQPASAVLHGKDEPGVPSVEEGPLQLPRPAHPLGIAEPP